MDRFFARVLVAGLAASALSCTMPGCKPQQESTPAATSTTTTPGASAPAPTPAPTDAAAAPLSVEETANVKWTAVVKAVDYTTRMVTLEDASGRVVTLVAGSDVRRLEEVKPGDTVAAEYTVTILAELRAPTAEEAAAPVAAVDIAGRAPSGSDPAAGQVRAARVVTTVRAVDQANMLVTLSGPSGDMMTVKGRNPDNVAKLKVGDTIVITYTETAVLALEKAQK